MRRRLAILPAAISALLLLTSPVAALGTLDQQQTEPGNAIGVQGTQRLAQVFTAGITGELDHVELFISTDIDGPFAPPGDDLTVEIWTVAGGVPASPVPGASAEVLAGDITQSTQTWFQLAISAPSAAGTQYAIVIASPANNCGITGCWAWLLNESNLYAGGAGYVSSDSGASWAPATINTPTLDFAFRTYVTPPAPSVAASLPNAAIAPPAPAPPLALGFGLLLVAVLGGLAVVNVRSRSR